jgi:hypothetical protein
MTSPHRPEIPTSTSAMLNRTLRRAQQLRRRRRALLTGGAAAVAAITIALPLALATGGHHSNVVHVVGVPTPLTVAPTTAMTTEPTTTAPPATHPAITGAGNSTTSLSPATSTSASTLVMPACASKQLNARLANPSGAAGSIGYSLILSNTGAPCTLYGYPGVSYVTASTGTTVGAPAQRDSISPARTVILATGQSAQALLIETDSLNYPQNTCQLTSVAGLRIYPPGQTAALYIPQANKACANPANPVLQIGPITTPPSPGG